MPFPVSFSHPLYLLGLLALVPVVALWWRARNPRQRGRETVSLVLRLLIVLCAVLGLSGLQQVRASDEIAVVFLLDVSDSIDETSREAALSFIRDSLAEMGPDDRAALILFGSDALVEQPMAHAKELGDLLSIPATSHTDVGQAVRLGLALLPATAQRRVVLLSDGRVTVPGAERAVQLAAAGGVEVDTVLLPARSGQDAWVDELRVPGVLYEGELATVLVRVQSQVAQAALVRIYADDTLVAERAVRLSAGANTYTFEVSAGGPGFRTFTAQIVPQRDVFYQNNLLGVFALVKGAPGILVVARDPAPDPESGLLVDDAAALVSALESTGSRVQRVTPAQMPGDLVDLGAYATTILVDVPAAVLGPRRMDLLQTYVRDLGRGLVCVGGSQSYGVGGYYKTALEETLPVEMTIHDKERLPPLAIVFAIDKSGSMASAAVQGGVQKIELAKEAVLRSLELLNPNDQVGVVAFDGSAHWVWPMGEIGDLGAVQQQVATLRADGGTDIYAALHASVEAIEGSDAQQRHVILLTDGGASQEGLAALVARLRAADGTLSTVGIGQDAAPFLRTMALDGGGRYHYTANPATLPQIFVQETSLAQRAYIVEETFYPSLTAHSPIMSGIDAVPVLHGYVATSIKPMAQMVLASGWQDPVLAQWQYGLGRAVAWTSDAKGQWARAWLRWEQFPRFWAQIVRWTIAEREESGLSVEVSDQGQKARLVVDVSETTALSGGPVTVHASLLSPSLQKIEVELKQSAPAQYEGWFVPQEQGIYLVRVDAQVSGETEAEGAGPEPVEGGKSYSQITGYARAYSPEYRFLGADEAALLRLAEAGGGEVLTGPEQVFARRPDAPVARTYTDVWTWLLMAAAVLLPVDVGVRRLVFGARDVQRVQDAVRDRLRRPVQPVARSERVSRLLGAKERATPESADTSAVGAGPRARPISEPSGTPIVGADPAQRPGGALPGARPSRDASDVRPTSEPEPADDSSMTIAERLLAAKKRAQKDDQT